MSIPPSSSCPPIITIGTHFFTNTSVAFTFETIILPLPLAFIEFPFVSFASTVALFWNVVVASVKFEDALNVIFIPTRPTEIFTPAPVSFAVIFHFPNLISESFVQGVAHGS